MPPITPTHSYRAVRRQLYLVPLIIAVPAAIAGIGSTWFAQAHLRREVDSRLITRAVERAWHVTHWIGEHEFQIGAVGRSTSLWERVVHWSPEDEAAADSLAGHLETIREVFGDRYIGFAVFGLDGGYRRGLFPGVTADREGIAAARRGHTAGVARFLGVGEGGPQLFVYAPIMGRDQPPVAVLVGSVHARSLFDLLVDLPGKLAHRVSLLDAEGTVLNRGGEVGGPPEMRVELVRGLIDQARRGERAFIRYRDARGRDMLAAMHWIPELGWAMLIEREAGEAYAAFTRWRIVIWSAVLGTIGFGFWLSTTRARRMVRRLEERETELQASHEQLITADRLASVGMMAASMAHEVNNPLTTIKILIHSIRDQLPAADRLRGDLDIVRTEIDKIKALVLRVLQFARPSDLEFATVDLNSILSRVVALIRLQAQARDLTVIDEDLEEDLPAVWADGPQMGQVFLNVLFNAMEAAPRGGQIRVATSSKDGDWVTATIWNSGAGIAPGLTERVFDPFFSTKATGTGLGLPIARIICEKHNGSIRAEGHGEGGTSFHVKLPRETAERDDAPRTGR